MIFTLNSPVLVYSSERYNMDNFITAETQLSQSTTIQSDNFKFEILNNDGFGNLQLRIHAVGLEDHDLAQIVALQTTVVVNGSDENTKYNAGRLEKGVYEISIKADETGAELSDQMILQTAVLIGAGENRDYEAEIPVESSMVNVESSASGVEDEVGQWIDLGKIELQLLTERTDNEDNVGNIGDATDTNDVVSDNGDGEKIQNSVEGTDELHTFKAQPMTCQITVDEPDRNTGEFAVHINGVPDTVKSVLVPIWCSEDQSDLIWYTATLNGNEYVVKSNMSKHQYHTGLYKVHIYFSDSQEALERVGVGYFDTAVKFDNFQMEASDAGRNLFDIQLVGLKDFGTTDRILFAVWSEKNGQDDLVWYTANQNVNDYRLRVDTDRHSGPGKYYVHCYAAKKDGTMLFLISGEIRLSVTEIDKVTAELTDTTRGGFQVSVEGAVSTTGIDQVLIPVWCNDDQSDIVWYTADKQGDKYVVNTDISKHQMHTGCYQAHVYLKDLQGEMTLVGTTSIDLDIKVGSHSVTAVDNAQQQYLIKVTDLQDFGTAADVLFAVWSEENGQDDLIWYTAEKNQATYSHLISISNHKGYGNFQVHCYVRKLDGTMERVCTEIFQVGIPSISEVSTTKNKQTGEFSINVIGATASGGIQKVLVPVWYSSNQSDLVWYTARLENGQYIVDTCIARHNNYAGSYHADVYIVNGGGNMVKVGTASVDMSIDKGIFQSIESSAGNMSYQAVLENVGLCGLESQVYFAVWSEVGGQDDLIWYTANAVGQNYTLTIPIINHMTMGRYFVDAYAKFGDGSMHKLASTVFQVTTLPEEKIDIYDVNGNTGSFEINVYVMRKESQVAEIRVPVWCSSDQSDIKWYIAEKTAEGVYHVNVNVTEHRTHFGQYKVHAYVVNGNGNQELLDTAMVNLSADNYLVTHRISDGVYKFDVYGANVNGTDATSVRFATWSNEGGQDDLVWYMGENNGDSHFSVMVYRRNHLRDGQFTTHIYLYTSQVADVFLSGYTYSLYSPAEFNNHAKEVMHNIIYAVETGGQIYGNARYDDFTQAYKNSEKETAITIGAGAWFATEAKRLLNLIRMEDPATFAALDTAGIGYDLDNADWSTYGGDGRGNPTILKGSDKAVCIQKLISTAAGIRVQDRLVDEQMEKYVIEAENLGVTDLKGRMFCANIRHLGGYSAMEWVIEVCIEDGLPLTMDNLWISMRNHTTNLEGNGVGANKYKTRHEKVMGWLNLYIG